MTPPPPYSVELIASDVNDAAHPERRETILQRFIRDTVTGRVLKQRHHNQCQICGLAVPLWEGLTYAEAHHIRPLGHPHMVRICPATCSYFVLIITLNVTWVRSGWISHRSVGFPTISSNQRTSGITIRPSLSDGCITIGLEPRPLSRCIYAACDSEYTLQGAAPQNISQQVCAESSRLMVFKKLGQCWPQ